MMLSTQVILNHATHKKEQQNSENNERSFDKNSHSSISSLTFCGSKEKQTKEVDNAHLLHPATRTHNQRKAKEVRKP